MRLCLLLTAIVCRGNGSLECWLLLRLSLLLTAIIGKRKGSLERRLWLMLYPVLPCVIGRDEMFLEHWLRLLVLLATHSLNIIQRHRLLHETWLRLHKIARERHHLLRKMGREVAMLLHVRHELIRLWCHLRVHVRIEHIRHLPRLHLHHRRRLESDMSTSIRSSTILKGRRPEHDALTVTLAVAFRLDAIFAYRSLFTTLDAAFATSQTSSFSSLAGEFGAEGCLCLGSVGAVQGDLMVAIIVGHVVSSVDIHLAEVMMLVGERVVGMNSACFGRVLGK